MNTEATDKLEAAHARVVAARAELEAAEAEYVALLAGTVTTATTAEPSELDAAQRAALAARRRQPKRSRHTI